MFSCTPTPSWSSAADTLLTVSEHSRHELDTHFLLPKCLYIRASRSPYFFAWSCTSTDK